MSERQGLLWDQQVIGIYYDDMDLCLLMNCGPGAQWNSGLVNPEMWET